jgi:glutaredoxin
MSKNDSSAPPANVLKAAARKFVLILLIAGAFAGVWYLGKLRGRQKMDRFAQCISDKGTVMYGLFWCPHCEEQKEIFASSFRNIHYVECGTLDHQEQPQCIQQGLRDFPTWQFADGERHAGGLSLQELAVKTGCSAQ